VNKVAAKCAAAFPDVAGFPEGVDREIPSQGGAFFAKQSLERSVFQRSDPAVALFREM
jgi:hypothetical protein